jgi:hypothetical protein
MYQSNTFCVKLVHRPVKINFLVDEVKSAVRAQHFWDYDAFGRLVILDDSGQYAW